MDQLAHQITFEPKIKKGGRRNTTCLHYCSAYRTLYMDDAEDLTDWMRLSLNTNCPLRGVFNQSQGWTNRPTERSETEVRGKFPPSLPPVGSVPGPLQAPQIITSCDYLSWRSYIREKTCCLRREPTRESSSAKQDELREGCCSTLAVVVCCRRVSIFTPN